LLLGVQERHGGCVGISDPNRAGGLANPLQSNWNLVTMMAKQKNNDSPANVLHSKKWHDLEQCLGERVLKTLLEWLIWLQLTTIKNKVNEIYKIVEEHCSRRGRRLVSLPFFPPLSLSNGVKGKEINREVELIKKHLGVVMGAVKAGEFVRRFCSNLGIMNNNFMMAVE
ncbi:hypothetical protein CUMW_144870, partial [Citrus unshiu]